MMERILEILLINAGSAAVLALLVIVAGLFVKRPAVLHLLWVVVLLKLITPPAVEIGLLPQLATTTSAVAGADTATDSVSDSLALSSAQPASLAPASSPPRIERVVPSDRALVLNVVWLAGALGLLGLTVLRAFRFGRQLRDAAPAPVELREEVGAVATTLGLRRAPDVGLIEGRIPPMLWNHLRGCRLLLPRELLELLTDAERSSLIAHELAHFRRRDHWVRYLEVLATALFWWCPLVWWVRRRVRHCEEQSCDLLVLESLPDCRDYANGLLKTLEFLADRPQSTPALATGAGDLRHLRERLIMILNHSTPRKLANWQRVTLGGLAVGLLLVFPTWADRGPEESTDTEREAEIAELEEKQFRLREQLNEVHLRLENLHGETIEHLRSPDHARAHDDAREARRQAITRELENGTRAGSLETELALTLNALEEARSIGDTSRSADLEQKATKLGKELRQLHSTRRRDVAPYEMDRLRRELERLDYAHERTSDRQLDQLNQLEQELRRADAEVEMSRNRQRQARQFDKAAADAELAELTAALEARTEELKLQQREVEINGELARREMERMRRKLELQLEELRRTEPKDLY